MRRIVSALLERGFRVLAEWLSMRAGRLSRSRLMVWCLVLSLTVGLGETWSFVSGLRAPLRSVRESSPVVVLQAVPVAAPSGDSMLRRLRRLPGWDSLVRARPGLADSVRMLERLDSSLWSR